MHKKPFLGLLIFSYIFSLKDTLKVDVQNLLALRLFLKSFLSGYNTRKYVLDFPRIQSPCCVGPTCGPAISSFHPIRARHQRVYAVIRWARIARMTYKPGLAACCGFAFYCSSFQISRLHKSPQVGYPPDGSITRSACCFLRHSSTAWSNW